LRTLSALFISLFTSLIWSANLRAGPIVVGGGAGGSEFSIVFARSNLPTIVSDCLNLSCGLAPSEIARLQPLLMRSKSVLPAVFKTSVELPGHAYEIHQGEIWFNKDLLWLDQAHTKPLEVSDAVQLWLEILDADGVISAADLALVKTKIAHSLEIERSEQAYDSTNSYQVILWKFSPVLDRLYVSSSPSDILEITDALIKKLGCHALDSLQIQSPAWISATPVPPQDQPDRIILKLSLNVNWTCDGRDHTGFGAAVISASRNSVGVLQFDPRSLDINIGEM
jgi:hypothetical protein